MFKLLKNLFDGEKEVDNNLFFDEILSCEPTVEEKPIKYEIPIESLAEVIRTSKNINFVISEKSSYASFRVNEKEDKYFWFLVDITEADGNGYLSKLTKNYYTKRVVMKTYEKPTEYEHRFRDRYVEEKEFVLTDQEALYLSNVIRSRNKADKEKMQKDARQEMENTLQSALNPATK